MSKQPIALFENTPRTDWFPGTMKPARSGVYEREMPDGTVAFAYFTGFDVSRAIEERGVWMKANMGPVSAHTELSPSLDQTGPRWRGLLFENGVEVKTVTDVYTAPPQATSGMEVEVDAAPPQATSGTEVEVDDLIGAPTPAKKPRAPRKVLSADDLIG